MKSVFFALASVAASCWAFDAFYRAHALPPARATAVEPASLAQAASPSAQWQAATEVPQDDESPTGAQALLGVWQTNIPGALYMPPSSEPGRGVLRVHSAGAPGLLRLAPDGTYRWNTPGAKQGRWVITGQPAFPIQLIDAAEHRRWSLGLDARTGELIVGSGSSSFRARRAELR